MITATRESFVSLQQEWEETLPSCATDTIFLTPRWQRLWWDSFGSGKELLLLALRQGPRLLGIAPLLLQGNSLSFLGDTDLFDYHDFIVPQGGQEGFYAALTDRLEEIPWERLELASIPMDSPTLSLLPPAAQARGWACEQEVEDRAPGLALPSDWEEYLEGLSKKDRHELRRKLRRLEVAGRTAYSTCAEPSAISACLDDFLSLMRESREAKSLFLTSSRETFFRTMAQEMADAGLLKLHFLELEGARVAGALAFDYRGRRLLYNSGFNPRYRSLSVGLLLKALCLKDAIEQGLQYFDFMRGTEPYKYDLGARDRLIYRLTITR